MIPNIKTCFNKNVTFLALALVLCSPMLSSLLHICTFKMKNNLKHLRSSRMAPKHAKLQIFIQANITVRKKTKDLPETTTFGWWSFYKGVL